MSALSTLAELSLQAKARRHRGYDEPLSILVQPGLTLTLPKPGEQPLRTQAFYEQRKLMPLFITLFGQEGYDAFMATNPDQNAGDALWELIGIEYDYVDAEGLVRYERTLARMKEARDKMRTSFGASIETDVDDLEPDPGVAPKKR